MPIIVDSVQTGRFYNQAGTREFAACTAWVNFDGTGTVAIRDSMNVSSITDVASGIYDINYSSMMDNANYSMIVVANSQLNNASNSVTAGADCSANNVLSVYSTSSVRINMKASSGGVSDRVLVNVAIFGGITL